MLIERCNELLHKGRRKCSGPRGSDNCKREAARQFQTLSGEGIGASIVYLRIPDNPVRFAELSLKAPAWRIHIKSVLLIG